MESVAYIRVSTEEQVHGTSLSMQQKQCLEFAKANGWKLKPENVFRDEGESAKAMNRPQLLAMLEFCRKNKGKVNRCIVWKLRLRKKASFFRGTPKSGNPREKTGSLFICNWQRFSHTKPSFLRTCLSGSSNPEPKLFTNRCVGIKARLPL